MLAPNQWPSAFCFQVTRANVSPGWCWVLSVAAFSAAALPYRVLMVACFLLMDEVITLSPILVRSKDAGKDAA